MKSQSGVAGTGGPPECFRPHSALEGGLSVIIAGDTLADFPLVPIAISPKNAQSELLALRIRADTAEDASIGSCVPSATNVAPVSATLGVVSQRLKLGKWNGVYAH